MVNWGLNLSKFMKNILYLLLLPIVRFTRLLVGVDKRILLFNNHTNTFADSSKYLFLHFVLRSGNSNLKVFWVTKNPSEYSLLKKYGLPVIYVRRPDMRTFLTLIRANMFITTGGRDFLFGLTFGYKVFSLWHGVTLKIIEWNNSKDALLYPKGTIKKVMGAIINLGRYIPPNYLLITSTSLKPIFLSAFRIKNAKKTRIIIDNYPRNDILVRKIPGYSLNAVTKKFLIQHRINGKKVILYTPTFREMEVVNPFRRKETYIELEKFLNRINAILIMKLHPAEYKEFREFTKRMKIHMESIYFLDPTLDIYPLLKEADLLITDYSSIYFDFLHLDRPIIFFVYDLESYKNERGFYFDFEKMTPGPKARTLKELIEKIEEIILKGEDAYKIKRRKIRELMFDKEAGNACERLYNLISQII